MSTDLTPNPAMLAPKLASLAAVLAVAVGVMVLVGWAFDIAVLKSILPGWASMRANAAVCFILTGIALWLTVRQQSAIFLARLFGLLAGLIGLLTLGEYVFGWELGIDQGLFRASEDTVGTPYPGRMAPEAAMNFVLLSVALWLTGGSRQTHTSSRARWSLIASVSLGLLVTTLTLAALLSYAMPALGLYGWFGLNIIAVHAAILFVMLGVAVVAISWRQDVLQWSLGRNATVALACGMAVLVFIGLSTNRSQHWLKEVNYRLVHNEEVLRNSMDLRFNVVDAQTHVRGYVITGNEHLKTDYLEAETNSNVKLDALRKLMAGSPHQQQQFAQIEMRVNEELQWLQQAVDIERTSITDADRSKRVAHGEDLLDNLRVTFDQIESEHRQLAERLKQESESMERLSSNIIFIGTLVSLMIFLSVIFRLNSAVSESRQASMALQNSEARLQTIIENLTEGLAVSDLDGQFLHFNRAALDLHGFTTLDECRQQLSKFADTFELSAMDGRVLPLDQWPLARVLRGENLRDLEVHIRHIRAGWKRIYSYGGTLVRDDGGQPLMAIVTISDITERKQAEVEIHQLNAELEQRVAQRTAQLQAANTDLEGFSYSVSHDLRAPLRAIDGFAAILREDYAPKLDDEGQRLFKVVSDNAKKMGQLIDDILAFSRAGRFELHLTALDMNALVQQVWQELEPQRAGRAIEFRLGDLPSASGDPAAVRQVWQNLLGNAIKFTRGREPALIEVGGTSEAGETIYHVRDNGAGFDMAYANKLLNEAAIAEKCSPPI